MKNKKLLQAFKIGLCAVFIITAMVIPTFAQTTVDGENTAIVEPPTSIYDTCYDLVNTYVFGGNVVADTYQDLVCIMVSVLLCLLCIAFPFIVVFAFLKLWFF